jgi:uncharacterized membrane protein
MTMAVPATSRPFPRAYSREQERPLRGLPSTAAVLGHPIHPMLVPFPLAFLVGALATDLAARATRDPFWSRASAWLLGAGAVTGVVAGAVGSIDYLTVRRARDHATGKIHAYGNGLALALAAANLLLRRNASGPAPTSATLALSALTAAVLGVTGWAGGELSYREMVGVSGHGDQHTDEEKRYVR